MLIVPTLIHINRTVLTKCSGRLVVHAQRTTLKPTCKEDYISQNNFAKGICIGKRNLPT